MNTITTQLDFIAREAEEKEAENAAFKDFVRALPSDEVDTLVLRLSNEVSPQIDCTTCGNCCRSLMVNITAPEVKALAAHLQTTEEDVKERYVECSSSGEIMVLNSIPCHFLKGNSCSIYEHRFTECREFPSFHQPHFQGRLFATFMHYGRCPIIYNVMEQMKQELGFFK
ncbi:YkgJ family cysteine cluster protein [Deminuibacter soli]|uniref:YkgJ family cysteine cluster protein n=1 Tax=Deminuibacter soli TaxID=2291815 RepID=UPI0011C1AA48|nr:YkgJ family cysteine cluster protein [Deminuibacter soli]